MKGFISAGYQISGAFVLRETSTQNTLFAISIAGLRTTIYINFLMNDTLMLNDNVVIVQQTEKYGASKYFNKFWLFL